MLISYQKAVLRAKLGGDYMNITDTQIVEYEELRRFSTKALIQALTSRKGVVSDTDKDGTQCIVADLTKI